jgi:sulfide:quinone oxidoreductase
MELRKISGELTVSPQIVPEDIAAIKAAGFRSVVRHRPDGEGADQPLFREIEDAARAAGLEAPYQPVVSGRMSDEDAAAFGELMQALPKPVFAFCRTGTRSASLWALSQANARPLPDILERTRAAGFDMGGIVRRIANGGRTPTNIADATHEVVIVGAGAAGVSVASSLLARQPELDIAIIDPADIHYYQPGWTLVAAGVFDPSDTVRTMPSVLPARVRWIKAAVTAFEPHDDAVILEGCRVVKYKRLVVYPGLKLDWHNVPGLVETLGRNGVTSNYRYDLAPYTWALARSLKSGRAVFTQPPMPIKCAGAPLFGVADYVPALMDYVKRYHVALNFHHNLTAIDGPAKKAWFTKAVPGSEPETVEVSFDMIHVTPPQTAPDFIRVSPVADAAGWADVDQGTLRHKRYANIYALGDVASAPNAKTAARKQAPVVAENLLADMGLRHGAATYDGYGSCPRQASAELPALADRRQAALAHCLVAEGAHSAANLLASNAERA